MDEKMAAKWFPFIGAIFLFIWYSNLIGFIPLPTNTGEKFDFLGLQVPSFALYAATANVSVPLAFSLIVFIAYTSEGIRAKGVGGYLKSLIPSGVTGAMAAFIFVLELLSNLMRIVSLSVRLFANMLAGHILLVTFSVLCITLFTASLLALVLPFSFFMLVALTGFEVMVAFLQAYIFTILAAVYIGGALHPEH
jgi:F-type H+-transporting ATPase subunit a